MVCQTNIDVSPIAIGWHVGPALMSTSSSPDGTLDRHWCLHIIVGLNAGLVVMNNATNGLKPR
jgi:hypothetical protein